MAKFNNKYYFILIIVFLLIWSIAYLSFLPGISDNDGNDIFKMILGYDYTSNWFRYTYLNDHHTLLYLFINQSIIVLSKLFGASNIAAISILCFVQMFVIILSLSYAIKMIYEFSGSKILLVISIIFFLFNPLIIQYSISHWKDVIFGSLILILGIKLFHLCCYKDDFIKNKWNIWVLIMLLIVCTFWRKNAIFITVIILIVLVIKFVDLRKMFSITLAGIIALSLVSSIIKDNTQIQKAHFSESIAIPLQQIAYTATQIDSLGSEQGFFENILPIEEMRSLYCDNTPDPIKFSPNFNDEFLDNHKLEFLVNYAKLGLKHFPEYIYAWAKQTESFWNPTSDTWYTVGVGVDLENGTYLQHNFFENLFDFESLKNILDAPLSNMNPIYNNAILVWLAIVVFVVCIIKENRELAIVVLPLILLWITLLLAVPGCDFRYVYPIHLSIPLLILVSIKLKNANTMKD